MDVFNLEYASGPQISPDGQKVIYTRNFKDVTSDANLSNLWIANPDDDGEEVSHQPITTGKQNDRSPRWSSNGDEIIYISNKDGSNQIYRRWLSNGAEARLTNLTSSPSGLSWSPDNKWIAFTMFVPASKSTAPKDMPSPPEGAQWADKPTYIDDMYYRSDGAGYLKQGNRHIFILSIDGGTPRQLSHGPFNHGGRLSWAPDGSYLLFAANRHDDWELDPRNSEVYKIDVMTGAMTALTDRQGPDNSPRISPDGKLIAYMGCDDRYQGYQRNYLYIMNADGSDSRVLSEGFDRAIQNIQWSDGGKKIYFQYDSEGETHIAHIDMSGNIKTLTGMVGGLSLGRPYSGGTFTVNEQEDYAYTICSPYHPADVGIGKGEKTARLTYLNDDVFGHKTLGEVEEIWYESSFDGRKIQGWICKPPNFDPDKKYPLLLEIHGGPFANYGNRFSAEVQLYASQGYVVLYTNPRGSTSYGEEFGNLIHHNYPGEDYDDLISGVDAVIDQGYIDENQLYVTGGSGGGVLTSWIVGHTDRFRAAVVAKPVINWYSFVLNADAPGFFYKYWFPGPPWEHMEHYMARSPISYVGNVTTPTMLLTGEEDWRTPMSETEQFYAGLKISGVDAAMVRIPGASHGIANKPSQLIAKVQYITDWFRKHKEDKS